MYFILSLIFFLLQSIPGNEWNVTSVRNEIIKFQNGKSFETPLYELKYIGQLKTQAKIPYLIISGRQCQDCDENISIYVHSPSDGKMKKEGEGTRYSYPGKEKDYASRKLIFEARTFYGNVLPDVDQGIIWYQTSIDDDSKTEKSVFLLEVRNDSLIERSYLNELPDIGRTLKLLKQKKCCEIQGMEITSEP
jgi:hypothetical protein